MSRDPVEPLARRATSAFGWSLLSTGLSRVGTLSVGIVLARLLGPAEFGTYAVALVTLMAVLSLNDLGVSLAIVRWEGDPLAIAPTVATLSVASSTLLCAGLYLTAPALAAGLGDPGATPIVRLLACSVVLSGVVATPAALLQREFRQRRRLVIDQAVTWSGAALTLVLALGGAGAWSLAVGRVAGAGLGVVLFVALAGHPYRLGFDPAVARRLVRFGLPLAGASALVFGVGYVEQVTVGGVLGATALGYYVLAYNLASWPVAMFSQPLRSVAPAAFARLQSDPRRQEAAFTEVLRALAVVTLPVCLLLAVMAPQVVEVVYGRAWSSAAPVLRWLALVAAVRVAAELAYDFLVVRRRTGGLLGVQVVWFAVLAPVLWWAAGTRGLAAVAVAQLVVAVVLVLPLYAGLLWRAGLTPARLLRAVWWPCVVSGAAAALCLVVGARLHPAGLALPVAMAVGLGTVAVLALPRRAQLRRLLRRDGADPATPATPATPAAVGPGPRSRRPRRDRVGPVASPGHVRGPRGPCRRGAGPRTPRACGGRGPGRGDVRVVQPPGAVREQGTGGAGR